MTPPRRPRISKRRFGQHFLEPPWADKVLLAIAPAADDTFLEIGAGLGALTLPLSRHVRRVVAFEIDRDLAAALKHTASASVIVVEGNFLDATTEHVRALAAGARRLRVAGNLPYNVASRILFKLIELYSGGVPAVDATLMIQREVADRLTALPGTREYGALTVLIGRHAAVEQLLALPPGAFRPAPQVRSALVRFTLHTPQPAARSESMLEALVKAVFGRRRKTLRNAVQPFAARHGVPAADALQRAALDGGRRPETLTAGEFVGLADVFAGRALAADRRAVL
jgi:16S rRNA (adenine1518-N6/adenine1519-N6)-dimethyltransferase